MNDLLFYTILIALLYYFFIYLPNKKKLNANANASPPLANPPLKHNQETQTETIIENEPALINCPGPQVEKVENNQELEKVIESLLKDIRTFTREIDQC